MQEFIDEVSKCRNEMLEFAAKMNKREGFFEGMIKAFGDVESILKFRYLEKEKDAIIDAHIEGQREFDDYPHTQWTTDQAEDYYKRVFTE